MNQYLPAKDKESAMADKMENYKVINRQATRGIGWVDYTQLFSDWASDIPISEWSIKHIKHCLRMADLDTFGTKIVLVARLSSYLSMYDCRETHAIDSTVRQAGEDIQ